MEERYEYDVLIDDLRLQIEEERELRKGLPFKSEAYRESLIKESKYTERKKELINQYKSYAENNNKFREFQHRVTLINKLVDECILDIDEKVITYEHELAAREEDSNEYEMYSKLLDVELNLKLETLKRGDRMIQREFNNLMGDDMNE